MLSSDWSYTLFSLGIHRFLWIFSKQLEAVCPQFTVNVNPAIFIICFTEGLEGKNTKTHFQEQGLNAVVCKGCSGIEFAEYWKSVGNS